MRDPQMAADLALRELFKTISTQSVPPLQRSSFHPSTKIRPPLTFEQAADLRERAHLAVTVALPAALRAVAASFAESKTDTAGGGESGGTATGEGTGASGGGDAPSADAATTPPTALALPPATAGDDVFLGLLQLMGRDYKAGCVICLSEEMMGTTCTCGHTEIVVFRPCGHSVCVEPCFRQLCTSNGIAPQRRTITLPNGQVMFVGSQMAVNGVSGFACPTCRTNVASCFRAENVHTSEALRKALGVEQMVKDIAASLLTPEQRTPHVALVKDLKAHASAATAVADSAADVDTVKHGTASGAGAGAPRSEED